MLELKSSNLINYTFIKTILKQNNKKKKCLFVRSKALDEKELSLSPLESITSIRMNNWRRAISIFGLRVCVPLPLPVQRTLATTFRCADAGLSFCSLSLYPRPVEPTLSLSVAHKAAACICIYWIYIVYISAK